MNRDTYMDMVYRQLLESLRYPVGNNGGVIDAPSYLPRDR
jgi:hypothetical protein